MKLYRYLEKEYVESFFDTGKLMLSSFERCRRHDDARADHREGRANFLISEPDDMATAGLFDLGTNTYIFCTSRVCSEQLMNKFNVNDYFVIKRPLYFMHAVRESLGGVLEEYIGDCDYDDNGVHAISPFPILGSPPNDITDFVDWSEEELLQMSRNMDSSLGYRGFFSKRSSYQDEKEFRFAWTVSNNPDDKLLIDCSGALRYCKRR